MAAGRPDLSERHTAALNRATTAHTTAESLILDLQRLWEGISAQFPPEDHHFAQNNPENARSRASLARENTRMQQFGATHLIGYIRRRQRGLEETIERLKDGEMDDKNIKKIENRLQGLCPDIEVEAQRWNVLRRCRNLTRLTQSFHAVSDQEVRRMILDKNLKGTEYAFLLSQNKNERYRQLRMKMQVTVDVVERGHEWVYIRGSTLRIMQTDLAEAGWDWGEHGKGSVVDMKEWEECPLAKIVRRLCDAAKLNRKNYIIPQIRVVLPRLNREADEDVAVFLEQLGRLDPDVNVLIEDLSTEFLRSQPPDADTALSLLVGGYSLDDDLTPTLNLDCSCLINMISDITHTKIEAREWQAESTRAMIMEENSAEGGVMAKTLWLILSGRELVCTKEVAEHFHQVLQTVGTPTERQRGHLIVPLTAEDHSLTPEERRSQYCQLSIHPPPSDLQIPITVLATDWFNSNAVTDAISSGLLPPVAQAVADEAHENWLPSKLSVYMQGWSTAIVTVTSERGRGTIIKRIIEENRTNMWERGPRTYDMRTTRNLLSKNAEPPADWETSRRPHRGT